LKFNSSREGILMHFFYCFMCYTMKERFMVFNCFNFRSWCLVITNCWLYYVISYPVVVINRECSVCALLSYLLSRKVNRKLDIICSSDYSRVKETCAIFFERCWNLEEHLPRFVCNPRTSPICLMLFSLISLNSLFPCINVFI
jgi:hypothetical protein